MILSFVLLWALTLIVLAWGAYEAFWVVIVGTWRLSTTATLVVLVVLFLFIGTIAFTPLCDGSVSRWDWRLC
jgi:hypothetical protein